MDLVKELVKAFEQANINYMHVEMNDLKLEMKKETVTSQQVVVTNNEVEVVSEQPNVITGTEVKSPIVGTFYSSPSPESDPFCKEGDYVHEGDTLCIVEAMKVMNEIKSPCNGTISRIFIKSGDFVEYDQPLIVIEED